MEFRGFGDWVEIFRGGKQMDSKGQEHDGDALIEKALATFDPAYHEPPAVIGHPKEDAPAYGWVQELKKIGDTLHARFKQVVPEFEDAVKSGLFKKRSAAFYPDGRLRHVGFLGAMPPAVKGLADVRFKEGEEYIEFSIGQSRKEDTKMTFKELKEKLVAVFTKAIQDLPEDGSIQAQPGKTFSEADIERAKKEAAEAAAKAEREKVAAEFAEKERTARHDARKKEISSWCEAMVKEGRLTPALVKFGVPEMLCFLASSEDVIEFGETKEKVTVFDRFKALFETEIPKVITFGEVATRDRDAGGQGTAGAKMEKLIGEKMKTDKALSYSAAFAEVQRENPELAKEYQQAISG